MRVYNSILADIKPLVGATKSHYVDAFDNDFALLLRERNYFNLHAMFKYALEVEDSLMASCKMKQRSEVDRRKTMEENQPSNSSSTNAKFDIMMKTMERLIDRLALDNMPPNRDQPEPQIRNPNFRIPPIP